MDLRSEILREHSKKQTMRIVRYVGDDKKRFAVLMKLFLGDEYRISQRAAWMVNYCAGYHPELIQPYLGKVIANLKKPGLHAAVKRNTVRLLQYIAIPSRLMGPAAEACFVLFSSKSEPVAVKCFSMTVLFNICKKEPGLKNELKLMIEEQLPYSSAGFRARAGRTLAALEKL
ncbi:MAG: hypothetical protein AB1458_13695 [Bacteroidota bacterium]